MAISHIDNATSAPVKGTKVVFSFSWRSSIYATLRKIPYCLLEVLVRGAVLVLGAVLVRGAAWSDASFVINQRASQMDSTVALCNITM